jgi:hypothetical protein
VSDRLPGGGWATAQADLFALLTGHLGVEARLEAWQGVVFTIRTIPTRSGHLYAHLFHNYATTEA